MRRRSGTTRTNQQQRDHSKKIIQEIVIEVYHLYLFNIEYRHCNKGYGLIHLHK